jgi:hypothetical protein
MPTQSLAPVTAAGTSGDIAVTAPNNKTVALYRALDDGLQLEQNKFSLLLENGDLLLLEAQAGDTIEPGVAFPIYLKDPGGEYNKTHLQLSSELPLINLPAGTWQVRKPATTAKIGVQYD